MVVLVLMAQQLVAANALLLRLDHDPLVLDNVSAVHVHRDVRN
jgi:hypothetical protein